jgi:hypothetical protein
MNITAIYTEEYLLVVYPGDCWGYGLLTVLSLSREHHTTYDYPGKRKKMPNSKCDFYSVHIFWTTLKKKRVQVRNHLYLHSNV